MTYQRLGKRGGRELAAGDRWHPERWLGGAGVWEAEPWRNSGRVSSRQPMKPTALAYVMQQHTTVTFDTVPETAKPPRLFLRSIFVADRPSGEQLADHPRRLDAGELLIEPLEEIGELLVPEAEDIENRGVEIAGESVRLRSKPGHRHCFRKEPDSRRLKTGGNDRLPPPGPGCRDDQPTYCPLYPSDASDQ